MAALNISPTTLDKWCKDGLRFGQRGTKSRYFDGNVLISFLFKYSASEPVVEPATAVTANPIRPHQIYRTEEVLAALKISPNTLDDWKKSGLRCSNKATKSKYFYGNDLIDFLFPSKKPTSLE